MNASILLAGTGISSVARIAMTHADAMIAAGHRVRIVTEGEPVTWRSSRAEWVYVESLSSYVPAADERVVEASALPLVVDEEVFRSHTPREHEPLRVLLCGPSQEEWRAVDDGYGAVAHARWFHQSLELVRVSPWAPSREEPLESVQEFHVALSTAEMTRLMHSCDVLVAPASRLTLTLAEALASGLACVMTSPVAAALEYPLSAPEGNAVELGERLIELLAEGAVRSRLRAVGGEIAARWRAGVYEG